MRLKLTNLHEERGRRLGWIILEAEITDANIVYVEFNLVMRLIIIGMFRNQVR